MKMMSPDDVSAKDRKFSSTTAIDDETSVTNSFPYGEDEDSRIASKEVLGLGDVDSSFVPTDLQGSSTAQAIITQGCFSANQVVGCSSAQVLGPLGLQYTQGNRAISPVQELSELQSREEFSAEAGSEYNLSTGAHLCHTGYQNDQREFQSAGASSVAQSGIISLSSNNGLLDNNGLLGNNGLSSGLSPSTSAISRSPKPLELEIETFNQAEELDFPTYTVGFNILKARGITREELFGASGQGKTPKNQHCAGYYTTLEKKKNQESRVLYNTLSTIEEGVSHHHSHSKPNSKEIIGEQKKSFAKISLNPSDDHLPNLLESTPGKNLPHVEQEIVKNSLIPEEKKMPAISSDLKPPEGFIDVAEKDLRVISTSLDPRLVITSLKKFRFVARTEVLHHRFTEKNGLIYLITCLQRYMWSPHVCKEACYLIAGFSAQHSSHRTLVEQGVLDCLIALACTHAQGCLKSETEIDILISVLEALGNFTANESKEIRGDIREKGGERLAALMKNIILKENTNLSEAQERKINLVASRLRRNLEYLCNCPAWDKMSKRNQKYYLNQEVYMLTKRGEPFFKLPK